MRMNGMGEGRGEGGRGEERKGQGQGHNKKRRKRRKDLVLLGVLLGVTAIRRESFEVWRMLILELSEAM
jgi:hypothetical protein